LKNNKILLVLVSIISIFSFFISTSVNTYASFPTSKIDYNLVDKFASVKHENISIIVTFKDKIDYSPFKGRVDKKFHKIPAVVTEASPEEIVKIASYKSVEKIYLNEKVNLLLNNSVPMIKANQVVAEGIDGTGIKVCIVDTGIDDSHPSLKPLIAEYDFLNNDTDATDDNGHGTHVAGIIASQDPIYKGVAPGTSLMVAKAFDAYGLGDYADVMEGIEWCADNGADIISLSLGGDKTYSKDCDGDPIAALVNNIVSDGIIVVVSAGNSGTSGLTSPGCASKAIAVGAVDKDGIVADFSSRGNELDLVAPGVSIKSTVPTTNCNLCDTSGFKYLSGTSMAAPHVAGVIALLLQSNPSLSVDQIKNALYSTTDPAKCKKCFASFCWIGNCRMSDNGYGIVNAYAAYKFVKPVTSTTISTTTTVPITTTIETTTTITEPTTTTISTTTAISTTSTTTTSTTSTTTKTTTSTTISTTTSTTIPKTCNDVCKAYYDKSYGTCRKWCSSKETGIGSTYCSHWSQTCCCG
jgi:subtilisin family serine protease